MSDELPRLSDPRPSLIGVLQKINCVKNKVTDKTELCVLFVEDTPPLDFNEHTSNVLLRRQVTSIESMQTAGEAPAAASLFKL